MPYIPLTQGLDFSTLGRDAYALATRLFPICRSITGEGIRRTLAEIRSVVPLELHEIPTGTEILDWTVPREWNIRDACITDLSGRRIIDFRAHNLHVVSYSIPIRARMHLDDLKAHLHTLPDHPDWIPYRTSYYKETWGFCLTQRQLDAFTDDTYDVCIDSTLEEGHLTYGEYYLSGETTDEMLISCHACHPSLANDNLSGVAVSALLARIVSSRRNRLSYRFLFLPGTIGSISWLARNEKTTHQIKAGLVAACLGDPGQFQYKQSRQGKALIDRVVEYVLKQNGQPHNIRPFSPYGYDERQYCSPGFDLPVGSLTRTPHGQYPEYHTSADNLDLITAEALAGSVNLYLQVFDILEQNLAYRNTNPKGEPQLGRRGLYRSMGGLSNAGQLEMALLWVLNLSDNTHTLLDIAERSGLPFASIAEAADRLRKFGLLEG
jgi:aminopeptidase-like protein